MQFCPTDDCFAFVVAACLNFPQEIERREYVWLPYAFIGTFRGKWIADWEHTESVWYRESRKLGW